MKSGNPDPNEELKLIIEAKQHTPPQTIEVVSKAARWLKAAFKGAGVRYLYSSCDQDHYGFCVFTIFRNHQDVPMALDLKIAEIDNEPYVFAQIRALNADSCNAFPFFGNLRSDSERELLLHYIADFILSTEESAHIGA